MTCLGLQKGVYLRGTRGPVVNDTVIRAHMRQRESCRGGSRVGLSVLWVSSVGEGVTRLGVPIGAGVSAVNQCSVGVMAVLFRGQENSMETKWSLLSSREWWRPAGRGRSGWI